MTKLNEFSRLTPEAKLGTSKLEALLKLLLLPQGPGAKIYTEQHLSWLFQPAMRQQLPPLYRFFAKYYAFQHRFSKDRVIWGDRVLMIVIGLTKFFRLKRHVQLSIAGHTVFLDLCDPRMLKVPNELTKSENSSLTFFLREGDTFVDLGANHGSFSIVAAQLVGSTGLILAIEPQPHLADLLEESLAANLRCKYQLCRIACGDRNGYIDFYIPTRTSGSAGIHPGYSAISTHCKLSVPLKRFDDAVDWQHFPGHILIKIDLSGNELAFLRGASTMIRVRKPHIMLAINPMSMEAAGFTGNEMVSYLQDLGYVHYVEVQAPTEWKSLQNLDTTLQRDVIIISPR